MPSKKCILFATLMEAEATLEKLQAIRIEEQLYRYSSGHILITGMGTQKTQECLRLHIQNYDEYVNLGIAGSLKEDVLRNTLFKIRAVSSKEATIQLQESGLHLFTHEKPLHDPVERDRLGKIHDLVDMEGFAIAKMCKAHGKACRLYKIVSDFCTETTTQEITAALPTLSKQLSHHLTE